MVYQFKCSKAKIYVNSKKKSLASIKSETGCDVVVNGGLYNMSTFKPLCHLKVDNKVLASDKYSYWGFAWNIDGNLKLVNSYGQYQNYICCSALCKDGKATTLTYNSDMGGKRGRTALGVMPNGDVVIYCSKDGTNQAMSPEALQKYVIDNGWKDAIMLDSGGSSQCITPSGTITSSRRVHNVLCFWIDKSTNTTKQEEAQVNGLNVKVYSKAKDGNKNLSANFKVKEFACSDGTDPIFISDKLVEVLQKIRTHFGKSVTINSGFRTPNKNKALGGAVYSQHLYGTAADITVSGVKPSDVADYAETLLKNTGGIGRYPTFTHIDVRAVKSRWNG